MNRVYHIKWKVVLVTLFVLMLVTACDKSHKYWIDRKSIAIEQDGQIRFDDYDFLMTVRNDSNHVVDSFLVFELGPVDTEYSFHGSTLFVVERAIGTSLQWKTMILCSEIQSDSTRFLKRIEVNSSEYCAWIPSNGKAFLRCYEGREFVLDMDRLEIVDTISFVRSSRDTPKMPY